MSQEEKQQFTVCWGKGGLTVVDGRLPKSVHLVNVGEWYYYYAASYGRRASEDSKAYAAMLHAQKRGARHEQTKWYSTQSSRKRLSKRNEDARRRMKRLL